MINEKKVVNYVKNRNNSLKQQKYDNLNVFIKDNVTDKISLKAVFGHINSILPYNIINLIDIVYVGNFDFLENRSINALYMDQAIYVSNEQDNNEDMIDDIIHEVAHAVEEKHKYFIYNDNLVKKEFLGKRNKLEFLLNYEEYSISKLNFLNSNYDKEFDAFMYNEVGNEKLNNLTNGLFLRGYSVVSLREYFATAFEEYYLGNRQDVKDISPFLYKKINSINEEEMETN